MLTYYFEGITDLWSCVIPLSATSPGCCPCVSITRNFAARCNELSCLFRTGCHGSSDYMKSLRGNYVHSCKSWRGSDVSRVRVRCANWRLAPPQRTSRQNAVNRISVCVSQRNALRLWCTADMLCPEASVQADPPPWLQSARAFLSRQCDAAPQLSPRLFSLPTWRLWTPQTENLGSQGTLHESRPAAFPVWWFRASTGRGERAAAGRQ